MSLFSTLLPIVRSVFSRWTALQIAVSHSMGGHDSEAKYEAFIEAFGQYLVRNVRSSSISSLEQEIQEYLDEILDEEFNTILDDGSSGELSKLFIRYIQLIQEGKLAVIQQELQAQQPAAAAVGMSVRNGNEHDSSSSSSENDDHDNEIREEHEEESINEPKSDAMDVDEDGWMGAFHFGNAQYSPCFFVGSILMFLSTLCCLTAFASPYWTKRYLDTPIDFQNIGLWELCLYKYRHYKDDLQIPYTGCFWFWTNEMYRFRDWIIPTWFKWVQAFATLAFIFTIMTISSLAVAVFSAFRWQWRCQAIWSIMCLIIFAFELIAISIYGVRSQDRLWMPRPEFNYLSYSYWFEFAALVLALFACIAFAIDIQSLRAPYVDDAEDKQENDEFGHTPNDSHIQLTHGRNRRPQSEL
ncbi:unnamed protein product [Rotaria socialis]|uniref:Pre-rRNA-processing protein TSR2 homolog n=4 Tax=Rotaria socialis TaxID=392032 RepID=A0A820HQ06_9BILA|nr:unnamed protein product [Rotaria socialis]CAF4224318.1 unnamed protein product [Rotaria socialis]CAF4299861.1 unnamed protein product [Rotaria socialis]